MKRQNKTRGIVSLYKSKQTVFTVNDIALLWREQNRNNLRVRIKYFADKGDLIRLRRGIYAKSEYDTLEVATKIYTPSYVSCETVLRNEGVIFQHYDTIFVISYLSRDIVLDDGTKITYRRIKHEMLLNNIGLERKKQYMIATKERALVDMVYLFGDIHFDNLRGIDWNMCRRIAQSYDSKGLYKKINNYL